MFEKLSGKGKSNKEEIDLSKRKFLKDTGKAALVATGVALLGPNVAREAFAETEQRDYSKDFDIGVKIGEKEEDVDKILGGNRDDVEMVAGGKYYHLDGYGLSYKRRTFAQMTAKYGEERMKQFLNFLERSNSPNDNQSKDAILISYGNILPRMSQEDEKRKIILNEKLYNISDLLEKGKLERLGNLFDKLKSEGYDKKYNFDWDEKTIEKLASSDEERKAMIEFQNKAVCGSGKDGAIYLKMKEYFGKEKFDSMTYVEKLRAFESMDKI